MPAPVPASLIKSVISLRSTPSAAICGNAATPEVGEPVLDAVLDVAVGLLAGLGHVHRPTRRHCDRSPRAVLRRPLLHHVPVLRERVEARP